MILETFRFTAADRWSVPTFPALDSPNTLVLLFASPSFFDNPEPIRELANAYPSSHLIGCSSAGEIFDTEILDDSIVVAVAKFERTRIGEAGGAITDALDSKRVGESLAQRLSGPDLRAILVLSDGIKVNGSELVRGLNESLPESVVVTGGLAGDGSHFQRTWIIRDGEPREGEVVAIGLYGDALRVAHGSKGGWDLFGPERKVTRSRANVLFELDGEPALDLYKRYLGERASGLPATGLLFPLALREAGNGAKQIVRTILAVDEADNSITFAGDIPEGSHAQLMRANFDRLVQGAHDAALIAKERLDVSGDLLAVAISCVGRRLVLGERTEEETEATMDILPPGSKQVGFYSYGEISPFTTGHCDLHNQTMTLTVIGEA